MSLGRSLVNESQEVPVVSALFLQVMKFHKPGVTHIFPSGVGLLLVVPAPVPIIHGTKGY